MASLDSSVDASDDISSVTARVPHLDRPTPLMLFHSVELRLKQGIDSSRIDPDTVHGKPAGPWNQVAGDLTFYDGKMLRIENAHVSNGNGVFEMYSTWPAIADDQVIEIKLEDVIQYDQGFSLNYPGRDELESASFRSRLQR